MSALLAPPHASEVRFETLTPDWLDAVMPVELAAYAHPWSRANFQDALAAGYQAQILLADALSGLGFYIEALRNAQSDSEEILTATINQFNQKLAGQSLSTDIPAISAEPALTAPEMPSEAATDQLGVKPFLQLGGQG